MNENMVHVNSISELHSLIQLPSPKHPLITVFDAREIYCPEEGVNMKLTYDFYMISLKDRSCGIEYGRNAYDFDEGVMGFSAPGQVYSPTRVIQKGEIQGWVLYFHPDLIRNTHLGAKIEEFSFFNYDVFEALHLSEEEEKQVNQCAENIQKEYEKRIDNHSQTVMVSNLELLLNYCLRFYERQFNTRTHSHKDIVTQFERRLRNYFRSGLHLEKGLPSIQYFSEMANLSQHYFSDLLKKETGRSPKDHINQFIVEQAKNLLISSSQSVSEIAYDLGFNYPHYFSRLFKSKTGQTPNEYRKLNIGD